MHLTPAQYIFRTFGGVRQTARLLGRAIASVSQWGREDRPIPATSQRAILAKAHEMGLDITPTDLILGRKVSDREDHG